jgi:NarL family two-component system sensor histidine kinase LiaS
MAKPSIPPYIANPLFYGEFIYICVQYNYLMRRYFSWQGILKPFRTLGWKLTLSYTLVTVVALLVVEIAVLGVGVIILLNSNILPRLAVQALVGTAPQLAPYLDDRVPDVNGLNSWLSAVPMNGFSYTGPSGQNVNYNPGSFTREDGQILILDPHKIVLATLPANGDSPVGQPIDVIGMAEIGPLVDTALTGEENYHHLYAVTKQKKLLVAAPIVDENSTVLGVMVFTGTIIRVDQSFGQIPTLLAGSLLLFTCAAGMAGTVFGLITARGLTRRLRTVTQAADAWSRGNFSVTIPDRSNDELGQMAHHLNRMSQQLENLMQTRQEFATLEERNRLARDLHDSVKQQVFATAMQVGAARELLPDDPSNAEDRLAEAEQLACQAQQELNTLIRELRPAVLENKGLVKALREYLADWTNQTGVKVDLLLQGERILPLEIEQTLYRVTQEALANVTRHSGATDVEVLLTWESTRVILRIVDNGHGFDIHAAEGKGVGLQSMRERVQESGGIFTVESNGSGTRIGVVIAIQKAG